MSARLADSSIKAVINVSPIFLSSELLMLYRWPRSDARYSYATRGRESSTDLDHSLFFSQVACFCLIGYPKYTEEEGESPPLHSK